MGLASIDRRERLAAQDIGRMGRPFAMPGIDAAPNLAEVVEFKPVVDWASEQQVSDVVSMGGLAALPIGDSPISIGVDESRPQPAWSKVGAM